MPYYYEGELAMSRYHVHPLFHQRLQAEYQQSWRTRAEQECQALADEMGTEAYAAWANQTWPAIDDVPYREIYDTAAAKLLELGADDECTCLPDAVMTCQACTAYLDERYAELPY